MKKLILLLAAVGMLLEMPSEIWAAGHVGETIYCSLTPGTYSSWNDKPSSSSVVYNINSSGEYHFSGTIPHEATFVVNADDVTIYLENFSMYGGSADSQDGFQIYGSSVELILVGESTITSNWGTPLNVKSTGSLTISSENDGLLNLNASGRYPNTSGYLALRSDGTTTIEGGTVIANGTKSYPGISGSGDLVVNDGTLIATGGTSGSGISLGSVTVNGGSVTANGNSSGAGVVADSVSVTGGSLTANGGSTDGAGIDAESVSVNGGSVVAESHGSAAGIDSDNIVVGGGTVSATSESGVSFSSSDPYNASSGAPLYCVTLPDATAATSPLFSLFSVSGGANTFTYTVTQPSNYSYSYSGSGLEGTNDLYFYLPNGTYVITGSDAAQGRQYGGTVNGAAVTFEVIPEPACGAGLLLAVLALCLKKQRCGIN